MSKTKTDNHPGALTAKVDIRTRVLDAVGRDRAHVFDAFAGAGVMWTEVWKHAADYVGCDDRMWFRDARTCFVADNRRVMRCIDLAHFNIFDLDSYGSPWEQALILAARRPVAPGERLGLVVTDGSGLGLRYTHVPPALRQAARIKGGIGKGGAYKFSEEIAARALIGVVHRMRCEVLKQWRAVGIGHAPVRYIGVVLEGVSPPTTKTKPVKRDARSPVSLGAVPADPPESFPPRADP